MEREQRNKEMIKASFGIREITAEDWMDYQRMRHEMLHCDPEAFPPQAFADLTKPDEFWKTRIEEDTVLIAYDSNEPIGMVRATFEGKKAKLWNMYTRSSYRGMGLGKSLMRDVLQKISERGSTSVSLEVEDTQIPARTMYERVFGFTESGRVANERGGYMITMERNLEYQL